MLRSLLSIPLLLLCTSVAHADSPRPQPQPMEDAHSLLEIQSFYGSSDLSVPERETRPLARFRLNKSGLELRREVSFGERDVVVGLKGPLMKRKRLGLSFELRF